jgi:hypothetical protein
LIISIAEAGLANKRSPGTKNFFIGLIAVVYSACPHIPRSICGEVG